MLRKVLLFICLFISISIVTNVSKAIYTYESVPYEVALSKIMIDAGIFSDSQKNQILNVIKGGYIYPDLSPSIKPFKPDSTPYEYYPFFKKASEYEIVEYDNFGNKKTYKLIDNISAINPQANITKSQFDKLLFVTSKMNPSLIAPYVGNGLSSITVNSSSGNSPFVVNFKGNTTLSGLGYSYEWDFGNGADAYGKNVSYVYVLPGTYEVKLLVTDKNGDVGISSIEIVVGGTNSCSVDTDGDGVDNCSDVCPLVFGDDLNSGCPIFNISKPSTKNTGYECSYFGKTSVIYGHYVCNSCPCNNFADFNADVRKCDLILPVLLSSDGKEIYSKGNYFQVK